MRGKRAGKPAEDPLANFPRLLTYLRTCWMRYTYPFRNFGKGVSIHYTCEMRRSAAIDISIGDKVYMAPEVWLSVVSEDSNSVNPKIVLGNGCKIGRRSVIAAKNMICLENDVLLAPNVLIQDHNHEYSDPDMPIHAQGATTGGLITIERNAWIGYGAAIICAQGHLVIGRNSVVGAHTVLTQSVPAHSVVAGIPARVLRRFDAEERQWIRVVRDDQVEARLADTPLKNSAVIRTE